MDVEISNRNTEKFIPHPILDDPTKMMRIIANPVYDKLTLSRAAQIRTYKPAERSRKSVQVNRPIEKTLITPLKSLNSEETIITPLSTNNTQSQSKSVPKRPNLPFSLPTRSSTHRISAKDIRLSQKSRTSSLQSSLLENEKKSITDGTIRYVHSRFGLEVQRYSSSNWLSIDLLTKDACESIEETLQEMLSKKEQEDLSSRNVFTSEYYRQRWEGLLQSYKDGHLTHDEWAKQNYQLNCLRTFYTQAFEREQYRMDLQEHSQRQKRAESVFNQWKETKIEGNPERRHSRLTTANSQRTTQVSSVLSNPSSILENDPTNRTSMSSTVENDFERLPVLQPKKSTKASYMLEEQRWSLQAMLKRIVGLAEPLPPRPKIINCQRSTLTNMSNDSGFESSP